MGKRNEKGSRKVQGCILLVVFRLYPSRYRIRVHTGQKKIWQHFTDSPEHQWHLDRFGLLEQVAEIEFQPGTSEERDGRSRVIYVRTGNLKIESERESTEAGAGEVALVGSPHRVATGIEAASWVEVAFSADEDFPLKTASREPSRSRGTLLPLATGHQEYGRGPLALPFDATVYLSTVRQEEQLAFETIPTRRTYLFVLQGAVRSGDLRILPGDRVTVQRETFIPFSGQETSQLILVDLP